MIATIILVEEVSGFSALFGLLILGVALAVAAVREGLPADVTAVLSLGVQRMATRNAIMRHLAAVEALGSADVIASDKTGTLTRNEMTVRRVATASGSVTFGGIGYAPMGEVRRDGGGAIDGPMQTEQRWALIVADRANNAVLQEKDGRWTVQGDPTEGALIVAAQGRWKPRRLMPASTRIAEVPFSSERKLMSTIHTDTERPEHLLAFTKGAPDILLSRCSQDMVGWEPRPLTPERRAAIMSANDELAGEVLRTLGVASRLLPGGGPRERGFGEGGQDLVFVGLIGMIGPPRDEARDAVARSKGAGIRPIMITGDHPKTAAAIASELGIAANAPGRYRRRDRDDVRHDARPNGAGGVGLCVRQSRTQAADSESVAARGHDGGHDGRRRQRRAGPEDRRHRHRHGDHRHRCVQEASDMVLADDTSPPSSRRWRKSARSSRISGNSCATCCRRTSARS
jgi:P-type Ca2+ transporter type 2C